MKNAFQVNWAFKKVNNLVNYWEEKENPIEEDHPHLINIHDWYVLPPEVAEYIFNLEKVGKEQYHGFVNQVLIERKRSIWEPIKNNKLKLFGYKSEETKSKISS